MDLASLLAPMTLSEFSDAHWNRRAALLQRRADRYREVSFDLEELRRHLQAAGSTDVKAQFRDAEGAHCEMRIEPSQMESCFAAGMTVCVAHCGSHLPALAAQAEEIRRSMNFCGSVGFNCYWSPENGGFGLHFDDHPVFILQLSGKKRWLYSDTPAVAEPVENLVYTREALERLQEEGADVQQPDDDTLASTVLEPGDLLFLPAGAWHKTTAVGGPSCALTFWLLRGSTGEVVMAALEERLRRDPAWRRPLPMVPDRGSAHRLPSVTEAVLADRLAALQQIVATLTVDDLASSKAALQTIKKQAQG